MTTMTNAAAKAVTATKVDEVAQLKAALAAANAELERARSARGISTMQVIRATLAKKLTATVAEIRDACKAAGVPARSDATIKTIRSDFMQTYAALRSAGKIAS